MKQTHSALLAFALLTTVTLTSIGQTTTTTVKITDPKLGTVKYGLETVEYWLERMTPGDQTRAKKIDRDLLNVIERYKRVKGADPDQSKEIVRRIQAAAKVLQGKTTSTSPKKPTASVTTAQASSQTVASLTTSNSATDGAKAIAKTPPRNAQEIIQTLQDKYHKELVVPKLHFNDELTAQLVDKFVGDAKKLRAAVANDLPSVRVIAKTNRNARYLLNLLENDTEQKIKRNTNQAMMLIDSKLKFVASYLAKQASLDRVKDAYVFANEKLMKKNERQFASMSRTLNQAVRLQKELGLPDTYTTAKQDFDANLQKWRSLANAKSKGRKLPKDIGDEKLRNIASKVLMKKKYDVGNIERIIVNAKVRPGKRVEHQAFAGKLETIVRIWDEYQVATIEKEDGKYYLYFNTLRKFTRAPRTTPVNEWILSKRMKSGEVQP